MADAKRKLFQPPCGPSGLSGVPEAIGIDTIRVTGRVFGNGEGSSTTHGYQGLRGAKET